MADRSPKHRKSDSAAGKPSQGKGSRRKGRQTAAQPLPPVPLDWLQVPARVTHDSRISPQEVRSRGMFYVRKGPGGAPRKRDLDEAIRALRATDARISNSQIARQLKVDRKTVRDRLRHLAQN